MGLPFFDDEATTATTDPRRDGGDNGDKASAANKDPADREKRHRVNSYYQRRMSQAALGESGSGTTTKSRRASKEDDAPAGDSPSPSRTRRASKDAQLSTSSNGVGGINGSGSRKLSTSSSGVGGSRSRETSSEAVTPRGGRRASREEGSGGGKDKKKEGKDKDKEFLARWLDQLPDLSFMLSSTLVFPSSSLAVTLPPLSPRSSSPSSGARRRSASLFDN